MDKCTNTSAATTQPDEKQLAKCIIERAKNYRKIASSAPTYQDYEYYKRMLHNSGLYGYESELADALGL